MPPRIRASLPRLFLSAATLATPLLLPTQAQAAAADVATDPAARRAALEQRLDRLGAELEALRRELHALDAADAAPVAAEPAHGSAAVAEVETETEAEAEAPSGEIAHPLDAPTRLEARATAEHRDLFISGLTEINYHRYTEGRGRDEATVRRSILGIGYRFDDQTQFVSEFELENAVVDRDGIGRLVAEQLFVDHRFSPALGGRVGLFLIPTGYLNPLHEPNRYFGVERNFTETAIIPSTEREGGLALHGRIPFGTTWEAGLTTSFDLSRWSFDGERGRESPLDSIHGELARARAADLAQYAALSFDPLPGLDLGGSVFTGGVDQNQRFGPDASLAVDSRFTLWEAHGRLRLDWLHVQALIAQGSFSHTGAINALYPDAETPIPRRFGGGYVEVAAEAWHRGRAAVMPFVRFERFNTASSYAALPDGERRPGAPTETVWTGGASLFLTEHLVLKADYQHFNVRSEDDRLNLGMGVQFY